MLVRCLTSLGYLCFNFTWLQFKSPFYCRSEIILDSFLLISSPNFIILRVAWKFFRITLSLIKLKMTLDIWIIYRIKFKKLATQKKKKKHQDSSWISFWNNITKFGRFYYYYVIKYTRVFPLGKYFITIFNTRQTLRFYTGKLLWSYFLSYMVCIYILFYVHLIHYKLQLLFFRNKLKVEV